MHDYLLALIGGVLIGLSASGMMLTNGRITGVSGILGGAIWPQKGETAWRWVFLFGLLFGGFQLILYGGFQFYELPNRSLLAIGIGGLLVGAGTSIGSGCTSGHGVCGISRLSLRSIVATLTFISSGIIATYVIEHILGGV